MKQLTEIEIKFFIRNQYPLTIVNDRYGGAYSGGEYLAFPYSFHVLDKRIDGNDPDCSAFWKEYDGFVGRGSTPVEALQDLDLQLRNTLIP